MINPLPELTPMLKQLRLSNMAETLAQRNREAIGKQLSYPEFLALLVQDEVARRDQKKYDSRLRRAGFRANKTIESFDMNFNPGINIQQINELTSCNFIDERVAVLIAGPCGTGKSHLAQAIGHCAVQKGYDVAFYTQAKLLAYLNAARATNMYERRFQALVKVPLLIIDDFGLKPLKCNRSI
jgi:DNA replication protein DnaC